MMVTMVMIMMSAISVSAYIQRQNEESEGNEKRRKGNEEVAYLQWIQNIE